jgi:hypothetical protein
VTGIVVLLSNYRLLDIARKGGRECAKSALVAKLLKGMASGKVI